MRKDHTIKSAIDESLASVHFDARDMHGVLRAVRHEPAPRKAPGKRMRFNFAFAAAMLLLVAAPLLALRSAGTPADITTIAANGSTAASVGESAALPIAPTAAPLPTPLPTGQPVELPETQATDGLISESSAIEIARACFEAQCDTSVFTFDEYTVSVQGYAAYGSDPEIPGYEVNMKSIYDNGCAFTIIVSAQDGSVISFSDPAAATVPASIDNGSPEVQSWYDKYGPYMFTWPQSAKVEFSRRYEGGQLREPRAGEVDGEYIAARISSFTADFAKDSEASAVSWDWMLYDGKAFADGKARYLIYCYPGGQTTDAMPETYKLVTMFAEDGAVESQQILQTNGL